MYTKYTHKTVQDEDFGNLCLSEIELQACLIILYISNVPGIL